MVFKGIGFVFRLGIRKLNKVTLFLFANKGSNQALSGNYKNCVNYMNTKLQMSHPLGESCSKK